jgi:hypothetical protein
LFAAKLVQWATHPVLSAPVWRHAANAEDGEGKGRRDAEPVMRLMVPPSGWMTTAIGRSDVGCQRGVRGVVLD